MPNDTKARFHDLVHALCTESIDRPIRELGSAEELADGLGALLRARTWITGTLAASADVALGIARELSAESPASLADSTALRRLEDEVASLPPLPRPLLDAIATHELIESALSSIVSDAIGEFSKRVNVFSAEWGIQGLLKKMPLGFGAVSRSIDLIKDEFDRRLEPEIKNFLQGFSRRAIKKMLDRPGNAERREALRRHIFASVAKQNVGAWSASGTFDEYVPFVAAVRDVIATTLARSISDETLLRVTRGWLDEHGDKTIRQWLAEKGIEFEDADCDALAEAAWPIAARALESERVREALRALSESRSLR